STTFADVSVKFWMTRTGLGISFGASTMLGLLVGLVMVGQTLYAMVLDRIQEFATLKAIGASGREVLSVLITQSATVALLGIIIGTLLAATIRVILSTPIAEIRIPPGLYAGSAGLVFVICMLASGLPYLRVRSVDPHSILQG
ncbi:MAG: FtsX-like permease family protein, partial [Planctomycetota bacterium]